MPLILGSQSAVATGYDIDNSCRFNAADTTYMDRTQTAGNQKTFTLSFWVKRSNVEDEQTFFSVSNGASYMQLKFNTSEYLEYNDGPSTIRFITSKIFQDPGAWMHICIKYDSTQSVEANRWNLFINGTQETAFGTATYPGLNTDSQINVNTGTLRLGIDQSGAAGKYSGYLAEVVLIDGTAYDASSFGEFDEDSPTIWKPIDVSGLTFGTNGFYLDFKDSSDFGSDVSGEANDLTDNNFVAAAQATDSPTNNFPTLNPLNQPTTPKVVFSLGNNSAVSQNASGKYFGGTSTLGMEAGKWYCEWKASSLSGDGMVGISGYSGEQARQNAQVAYSTSGFAYLNDGQKKTDLVASAYDNSYTTANVVGIAVDLDNLKIYFAKDNTWQDSGDPTSGATGTGAAFTILAASATPEGFYAFSCADNSAGSSTWAVNFGGCSGWALTSAENDENGYGNFEYAPPSGYLALCTKNLGSDGG